MGETRMVVDDEFAVVDTVLAADVADSGTFDVAYPTGFVQGDFNSDLAGAAHYAQVGLNDRWAAADAKMSAAFGASAITVTNSSGVTWTAGTRVILHFDIVNGNNVMILALPITLANITGAGDVLTEMRPGVDGVIEHVEFAVTTAVTTAAKAASLNLEIDTTNVTGGVVALTSANATPLGKVIAGSAITAANRLYKKSLLSVEAASVTAFVEGAGVLYIRIRRTTNI